MIWLLFKNCGRKKDKSAGHDEVAAAAAAAERDGPQKILRELLSELQPDADDGLDGCDDRVFVTDAHFACLAAVPAAADHQPPPPPTTTVAGSSIVVAEAVDDDRVIAVDATDDAASFDRGMINKTRAKVTEKRLGALQCPFTWTSGAPAAWWPRLADRVQNRHGAYNCADVPAAVGFSFEKYISNLIISCGLFKTNKVDRAHDKLTNIWNWLDKLDDTYEPSYLAIRDGLKHVVMSTLCYILFASNKAQCQQLFEMITWFNHLNSKSRAAVNAVRAAFSVEIGGEEFRTAVQFAKKACALDPDCAHWNYLHSVAMTARRQHLNTCKSCPTEAEFDAVQHAIIVADEPNPYFNFHRMNLMANKTLYHCYLNNSNGTVIENPPEQMKQDFQNVLGLIRTIVGMDPADPHLIVKCAKSLMTLPYFNRENIQLAKQVVSIAVNMAFNDSTVIEALKESIGIYKRLISECKQIIEKKNYSESINVDESEGKPNNREDDFENDLKSIVNKYKRGSNPTLDFISLLDKHNGRDKWRIMAQICSYSILFKGSESLLVGVEQFMMLINDEEIAKSDIVTDHRSIFISDRSKAINLAELVCNEIKLAVTRGRVKNPDQTQLYLDHLTKIMEVCQLKSKKLNPELKHELLKYDGDQLHNGGLQIIQRENKKNEKIKLVASQNTNKIRRSNQNSKNNYCHGKNYPRIHKSKTKRKNIRIVLKNAYSDGQ